MFDILILNGAVVDGTGSASVNDDIAINGGRTTDERPGRVLRRSSQ